MSQQNAPLPPHDKRIAYIEVSKTGFKFLCVLVDGSKRQSLRFFFTKRQCIHFADAHGLDVQFVGGAAK